MDADEHRLIVDFYLCQFVFIYGCWHRFHSESSTVTSFWFNVQRKSNTGSQVAFSLIIAGQIPNNSAGHC